MSNSLALLLGLSFLATTAFVLLAPAWWRARDRRRLLELADAAIQRGVPLSADAIRVLPGGQEWLPQSKRDLRKGVQLTALGLAFFLTGVFVYALVSTFDPRSSVPLGLIVGAFGAFPVARGVALIVLSRIDGDDTV